MSCLTCGAKETAYLMNKYPVCGDCLRSIEPIFTPLLPIERFETDSTLLRTTLSAACFAVGLIAAATIAWLGGWA